MGICCIPKKEFQEGSGTEEDTYRRVETRETHNFTINHSDLIKVNLNPIKSDYVFHEVIARGSFGMVWLATHRVLQCKRAIKQLNNITDSKGIENLLNEVSILKMLDHPNIIKIFEVYRNRSKVFIVTELCEGGELFDKILQLTRFSENQAAEYMLDIVSAVMHCHDCNIVHRDLKPENFLFDVKGANGKLKLIDFGSSKLVSPSLKFNSMVGTFFYMAPEIFTKEYDKKVDVWSLGVILYAMLSGSVPFPGHTSCEIISQIKNAPLSFTYGCWDDVSEEARFLVSKMLEKKPANRYTIAQVFNNNWLQTRGLKKVPDKQLNLEVITKLSALRAETKLEKAVYLYIVSQLIEKKAVEDLGKVFKIADKNNAAVLSVQDIQKAAEESGLDFSGILEECEIDRNGCVSYNEFLGATVNRRDAYDKSNLVKAFKKFDKNGDGKIDLEGLREIFGDFGDDVFEKMMEEVDMNRDGIIDLDEYVRHMKNGSDKME